MAVDPHVHEYAFIIKTVAEQGPKVDAFCRYPECDHSIDAVEIIKRINSVERFMAMADDAQREVAHAS